MYSQLSWICVVLSLLFPAVASIDKPVVNTKYGKVRGFSDESKTLTKFMGIPFAKPPVGSLRLMKPVPPESWREDTLDAMAFKPSCEETEFVYKFMEDEFKVFPTYERSEDCLYLNVFVPGNFDITRNQKRAVMVWIYGGGYMIGNANFYPSDSIAIDGDVIVVTFNYRLGMFGFASSDDGVIPGNMGLFDQHAALKWVNENIAAFGGDPQKVTIFGESAGADSVLNHLASPLSGDLFSGVISQSPPVITRLKTAKDQYAKLLKFSEPLCGSPATSRQLLDCLQQLSAAEFGNITSDLNVILEYECVIMDGEFLPENPRDIILRGDYDKTKTVALGYTGDDGDSFLKIVGNFTSIIQEGITKEEALEILPMAFNMFFQRKPLNDTNLPLLNVMKELITREYFTNPEDPMQVARGLIDVGTDFFFASKCFEVADALSSHGGTVYLYKFDHLLSSQEEALKPGFKLSAGHGNDIFYEFYFTSYNSDEKGGMEVTGSERQLAQALVSAFTQVAKSDKPVYLTAQNQELPWIPYTKENPQHLVFTTDMTEDAVKQVPAKQQARMALWNSIFNNMYETVVQLEDCLSGCQSDHNLYDEDQQPHGDE